MPKEETGEEQNWISIDTIFIIINFNKSNWIEYIY